MKIPKKIGLILVRTNKKIIGWNNCVDCAKKFNGLFLNGNISNEDLLFLCVCFLQDLE